MIPARTALPLATPGCSGGGLRTIDRILREVPGVVDVFVDPALEMVYVEYDPDTSDPDALFAVLKRAGLAPADRVAVRRYRPPAGRANPAW
jgi:copper chaperone CopZ